MHANTISFRPTQSFFNKVGDLYNQLSRNMKTHCFYCFRGHERTLAKSEQPATKYRRILFFRAAESSSTLTGPPYKHITLTFLHFIIS